MNAPLVLLAEASGLPPGDDWLHPGEREELRRLRAPRRRRDYRLGRFAARRALAMLEGAPPADACRFEVRRAPSGVPRAFRDGVPLAVALSISHSEGHAAAAARWGSGRLGCDLESVESRSRAFRDDYFTVAERDLVEAGDAPRDRALRATLVWSAKEAVMKALGEGLRLPPCEVEVCPSFDAESALGWRGFAIRHPRAAGLAGSWRELDGLLLTVAGVAAEPRLVQTAVAFDFPRAGLGRGE